jgi:hypothetical protein
VGYKLETTLLSPQSTAVASYGQDAAAALISAAIGLTFI